MDPDQLRQCQELVAAKSDPRLKTVSHILRDAVYSWLHAFHDTYAVAPELSSAWSRIQRAERLEDISSESDFVRSFISTLDREYQAAMQDRDHSRIQRIRANAWEEYDSTSSDRLRTEIERILGTRD
jgi:hypothetical protein